MGNAKKNSSGAEQWSYKCEVLDAEATHKISCDEVASPDPSLYFKAFQVSLSDPSSIVEAKKSIGEDVITAEHHRFAVSANSSSSCNCYNSCLSRTWEECCQCNDCANDPAVAPHCSGAM